jgi:hypothetical protein
LKRAVLAQYGGAHLQQPALVNGRHMLWSEGGIAFAGI